jgi:hypothetical protein
MAVAPPLIAFTALIFSDDPLLAAFVVLWSGSFFASLAWGSDAEACLGMTIAEWLTIVAIVVCTMRLIAPIGVDAW